MFAQTLLQQQRCRVCGEQQASAWLTVLADRRTYWRCAACGATTLEATQLPDPATEAAQYRLHQNDPLDAGYRQFLGRLAAPLGAVLAPGSTGLDFCCGPGPALAMMLRDAGHHVAVYDPFFFPDPAVLQDRYDFITATEVLEHLHQPAEVLQSLTRMLRPGGTLAFMTSFQTDDARFPDWHYRRDPTHVTFYREATLRHLAHRHGFHCRVPRKDVVLWTSPVDRRQG